MTTRKQVGSWLVPTVTLRRRRLSLSQIPAIRFMLVATVTEVSQLVSSLP